MLLENMPDYLLVYHGGVMPDTAEARVELMARYDQWFQELGEHLVDGGHPVGRSRSVSKNDENQGTGSNPITGYTIIRADSLEAAVELANRSPFLEQDGTIEVCETFIAT